MFGRAKPTRTVRETESAAIESAAIKAQVRLLVDGIRKTLDDIDELIAEEEDGSGKT